MCGILGKIYARKNVVFNEKRFVEALNLQNHRGPDDSGYFFNDCVALGHRRLSILDLSENARQPMHSANKLISLVFNGEIYNFREIKKELISTGINFRTTSDTEVLIYLYEKEGIKFIQRLNGMFAIALYDKRTDTSYLIRDRLGIKPLYFYQRNGDVTFSSEIKSILHFESDKTFESNESAFSSYLSFRYPILNDSYFKEINPLPPAHYLKIKNGKSEVKKYWDTIPQFHLQKEDKGEAYYIEELRRLLHSSVEYRMISDVPLGAFLSGGVDSSVLTAIMAQKISDPVKTFTIGFNEKGYNEFEYANLIAKRYKTDHSEILLSGSDYIQTMDYLIGIKDAPLSVPNEVPLYLMSKELKKEITVVLSGEGADEIFGGYGRIFRSPYDYYRSTKGSTSKTFSQNLIEKYGRSSFDDELDHFYQLYAYTSPDQKSRLLNEKISNAKLDEQYRHRFRVLFEELGDDSYYNKMMYAFEMVHLQGLLNRADLSTMAASVEARVPFVDHRLVEFAFSIPVKYKLKWRNEQAQKQSIDLMSDVISEVYDTPKYILKKAFEQDINKEVLYRKKMGFPVPLNNWFGGDFKNYAKEILLDTKTIERGQINVKGVQEWLNSEKMGKDHGHAMKIWMLINIELFNRKYF